jgi:hypothetical protein
MDDIDRSELHRKTIKSQRNKNKTGRLCKEWIQKKKSYQQVELAKCCRKNRKQCSESDKQGKY